MEFQGFLKPTSLKIQEIWAGWIWWVPIRVSELEELGLLIWLNLRGLNTGQCGGQFCSKWLIEDHGRKSPSGSEREGDLNWWLPEWHLKSKGALFSRPCIPSSQCLRGSTTSSKGVRTGKAFYEWPHHVAVMFPVTFWCFLDIAKNRWSVQVK